MENTINALFEAFYDHLQGSTEYNIIVSDLTDADGGRSFSVTYADVNLSETLFLNHDRIEIVRLLSANCPRALYGLLNYLFESSILGDFSITGPNEIQHRIEFNFNPSSTFSQNWIVFAVMWQKCLLNNFREYRTILSIIELFLKRNPIN